MHRLQHPYPAVAMGAAVSCGGNQNWSSRWDLRRCGCGAVAMTDLVLYLTRHHGWDGPAEAALDPVPLADYDRLCSSLQRKYLPMVPPVGVNGLALAAGVSLLAGWLLLLTMDALDLTHFSFLPALLEVGVLVALSGVVLGGLLDYLALRKTHLT